MTFYLPPYNLLYKKYNNPSNITQHNKGLQGIKLTDKKMYTSIGHVLGHSVLCLTFRELFNDLPADA